MWIYGQNDEGCRVKITIKLCIVILVNCMMYSHAVIYKVFNFSGRYNLKND